MMMMKKTCHKCGKRLEMMRAQVEEVRRGMSPLVNIMKGHLKCYQCYQDENDDFENGNDEGVEKEIFQILNFKVK